MDCKYIVNKINQMIKNIKQKDIISNFPEILNDLHYIYYTLEQDESKLDDVDIFMNGPNIDKKVIEYFSIFTQKYIKFKYNTDIEIELHEDYNLATASGAYDCKDNKIKYATLGILIGKINTSSYLHTFLHEAKHKMQHDSYSKTNAKDFLSNSENAVILAKEFAYGKGKENDNGEFYMSNYNNLYVETDAEIFSHNTIKTMLMEMFVEYKKQSKAVTTDELRIHLSLVQNKMKKNSLEIQEKRKERMNLNIVNECYGIKPITSSYVYQGEEIDKLIALDKYIKNNPEIQETMPIFKLIFNENVPKTYDEINIDKQRLIGAYPEKRKQIIEIYNNIIKSDPILYLTYLVENNQTNEVIKFVENHNTIFLEYPEEIEKIINKYWVQECTDILIQNSEQKKR